MADGKAPGPDDTKREVAGVFGRAAPTYDHVGPRFFSHFGRRVIELLEIPSGSSVLDVATGRGAQIFPAARAVGPRGLVTGIDISEGMVKETAEEIASLPHMANVDVRQMDAEHLQFQDESFDFVLCGFAVFFFPQLQRAMSEFRRVLKPGGRVCITTWDKIFEEQWKWFDELSEPYLPPEPETPETADSGSESRPIFDTTEGVEAILSDAGFQDLQVFSEAADFSYSNEEEYWSALWSHGLRDVLETIEREAGADALEKFRLEVIRHAASRMQPDGIHHLYSVLVGLATKPPA